MFTVKVSAKFLADREQRDLPVGLVKSFAGNKATTAVAHDVFRDMVDDAAYQGWFTDSAPAGFTLAARTAFRDLINAGGHYPHGTKTCRRTGKLMPKDANDAR
ncbi:MAG: hypothetical protein EBR45_13195 [Betaproteobacteria bacterium]|nr:hypothetical protein [Betaproteobacteria bacterium]